MICCHLFHLIWFTPEVSLDWLTFWKLLGLKSWLRLSTNWMLMKRRNHFWEYVNLCLILFWQCIVWVACGIIYARLIDIGFHHLIGLMLVIILKYIGSMTRQISISIWLIYIMPSSFSVEMKWDQDKQLKSMFVSWFWFLWLFSMLGFLVIWQFLQKWVEEKWPNIRNKSMLPIQQWNKWICLRNFNFKFKNS